MNEIHKILRHHENNKNMNSRHGGRKRISHQRLENIFKIAGKKLNQRK